jgi:AcrR family transcriptional regulator
MPKRAVASAAGQADAVEPIGRRNRGPTRQRVSAVRQAQKELTRSLLLDAASTVFEARPYVEIAIDEIARAAGASRATFYLYFESKAAILRAVERRVRAGDEARKLYNDFVAIERPTVAAIQAWWDAYVDFYLKHRGFHRALHQARVVDAEFARYRLDEIDDKLALWHSLGWIDDVHNDALRVAAMTTSALNEETLYIWLVDGFQADRAAVTRALAEYTYAALQIGKR